ncbi:hypothetical protein HDU85_005886 [Gaertneriomyces sp. JEL0708]|nr:hypothetical protein HDU85_005886 [Gaertneriomyces sp. JEL0708]
MVNVPIHSGTGKLCRQRLLSPRLLLALLFLGTHALLASLSARDSWLPQALSADPLSDAFSGVAAKSHLLTIGSTSHPADTKENLIVRQYVASVLSDLALEARKQGKVLEVQTGIGSDAWSNITRNYPHKAEYYEATNIVARLQGELLSSSVLISSHVDSVSSSHGATDAGVAIAVMLESLRALILSRDTQKYSIVFNFNNGEEKGLLGSKAFLSHPWWETVKIFLNVDAGGVGGRDMLVRATHSSLIDLYAKHAPYPHAIVYANDEIVTKAGPSGGFTDFRTYALEGKRHGIDLNSYERAGLYHTVHDTYSNAPEQSLQNTGANSLALLKKLANSPLLDELGPFLGFENMSMQERPMFYDYMGRICPHRDMASFVVQMALLTVLMAVASFWITRSSSHWRIGRGILITSFLIMVCIGVNWVAGRIMATANAAILYGRPWLVCATFFFLCLSILLAGATGWNTLEKRRFNPVLPQRSRSQSTLPDTMEKPRPVHRVEHLRDAEQALLILFGLVQLAATLVASRGIGMVHPAFWLSLYRLLSLLTIHTSLLSTKYLTSFDKPSTAGIVLGRVLPPALLAAYAVCNFLAVHYTYELLTLLFRAGTPWLHGIFDHDVINVGLYYNGTGLFALLSVVMSFPIIVVGGRCRLWAGVAAAALGMVLLALASTVFPYSLENAAPATIKYYEFHTLAFRNGTLQVNHSYAHLSGLDVERVLRDANLDDMAGNVQSTCTGYRCRLTIERSAGELEASPIGSMNIGEFSVVPDSNNTYRIALTTPTWLSCYISLNTNSRYLVENSWIDGMKPEPIPEYSPRLLHFINRRFGASETWHAFVSLRNFTDWRVQRELYRDSNIDWISRVFKWDITLSCKISGQKGNEALLLYPSIASAIPEWATLRTYESYGETTVEVERTMSF